MNMRFFKSKIESFKKYKEIAKMSGKSMYWIYKDSKRIYKCTNMWLDNYKFLGLWRFDLEKQKDFLSQIKLQQYRDLISEDIRTYAIKDLSLIHFNKLIKRDWILTRNTTKTEIENFILSHNDVIKKELVGFGGTGIQNITRSNLLEDDSIVEKLSKRDCVIEERIYNHHKLREISPLSLSTVRVVTIANQQLNIVKAYSILRMSIGNAVVDNFTSGGIACKVDWETGKIISNAYDKNGIEYVVHPISGIKFIGFALPNWELLKEYVKQLVKASPNTRLVGWDIAIEDNSVDLIEPNANPCVSLLQIDREHGYAREFKELYEKYLDIKIVD